MMPVHVPVHAKEGVPVSSSASPQARRAGLTSLAGARSAMIAAPVIVLLAASMPYLSAYAQPAV
jgi:hypothetical protein